MLDHCGSFRHVLSWGLALLLGAFLVAAAVPPGAAVGRRVTPVVFEGGGGVRLHGSVVAPPGSGSGRPGMVLVHGSGLGRRTDYLPEAEAFARRGVVVLVYDKRTDGYSTFHRDYGLLAADAVAATERLRAVPGVDPDRVGFLGISEGGAVAALAAVRSPRAAYLVTVGAAGMTPARQQAWSYRNVLEHAGISGSLRAVMHSRVVPQLAEAGLFSEARYDPLPVLRRVRQPVLALWGAQDKSVPPCESAVAFRSALSAGAGHDRTVRVLPGGEHGLHTTPDGGYTRQRELVAGFADNTVTWIHDGRYPDTTEARDPCPRAQERASTAVGTPPRCASPWVQVVVLCLLLIAFGGYLVTGAVSAFRSGRASRRRGPVAARWTAAAGIAVVPAAVGWLGYVVLTAAQHPGPVVAGRPVAWLFLQLLALAVVAGALATVWSWRRAGSRAPARTRILLLLAGAALFVPWSLYWGLLVP